MTSPCSSTSGPSGAARAAPSRPILDEIARDHDEVTIVKLNTDENPAITGKLGITSIPTMHVYQNGEIVKTIIGAMPKPKLLRELEPFLAPDRQLNALEARNPLSHNGFRASCHVRMPRSGVADAGPGCRAAQLSRASRRCIASRIRLRSSTEANSTVRRPLR